MSRKNKYGLVLVVVAFAGLMLSNLACTSGGCDGEVKDGVCQGTFTQPDAGVDVEKTLAPVTKGVEKLNKAVETTVIEKTAPKVKESVDQIKDDPENPFNAAGAALDEQSCKARGGVWFASACNK